MKDSLAADAMTTSGSTETTGLCSPPVRAIQVSVMQLSATLTAQEYLVRRTSNLGLVNSNTEYAIAAATTATVASMCWRTQSGPTNTSTPTDATTAMRTATTMRAIASSSPTTSAVARSRQAHRSDPRPRLKSLQ